MDQSYVENEEKRIVVNNGKFGFYVIRYVGQILGLSFIGIGLWYAHDDGFGPAFRVSLMALFPIFLSIYLMIVIGFRNFAYKAEIDPEKKEIVFYMCRKEDMIAKTQNINSMIRNLYLTFNLDGKKIVFPDQGNLEFLKALNDMKPITWKFLAGIIKKDLEAMD
ncbi:hypothetical protein EPICR_10118 [Candidatus Desulfarcum epimagneticum]|uniref:Uncharacterized protein n=1 Tax=uncultured Desulfobacteraceae bacterium TaxID=218296 RepID=A0A484HD53_9BACT|nr:hypothetical protein EPICR_10118 [uncultured Desulfobacteraceae bacterium]